MFGVTLVFGCNGDFIEQGIQRFCDDDQALRNLDNHTVSKVSRLAYSVE